MSEGQKNWQRIEAHVNVTYPKYKSGGEVVREIAVAATYGM